MEVLRAVLWIRIRRDPHPGPEESWILIRIKVISWIRIRIKVISWTRICISLQMTSQNVPIEYEPIGALYQGFEPLFGS